MKFIKLSSDKKVIVNDEDFEYLKRFHWYFDGRYAARSLWNRETKKETKIYMHRELLSVKKGEIVDHVNKNMLDNRRENLRIVDAKQNAQNQTVQNRKKHSRFKGVSWDKSRCKWIAYCKKDRKMHNLGRFDSEIAAAKAYNAKALELFGEYASINKIN